MLRKKPQSVEQRIRAARLKHARELDLSECELQEVPESLASLPQLEVLNLRSNKLTVLPKWLSELTALCKLELSHNELSPFPETIRSLVNLEHLIIADNPIFELPQWIGELKRLTFLNISTTRLRELPISLCDLTQLQALWCGHNQLLSLPHSFGNLAKLQALKFSGFKIEYLPGSIRKLTSLRVLWLESCELRTLPDWIGELHKLEDLQLYGNNLIDLPPSLGKLTKLREFSINENPLGPELQAAWNEGLESVKRYLRAKLEAQAVLNEAKLILVGEGEVGKSCLLSALRGDEWVEGRPTTHGIEILPVKVTAESGTQITLNGWDFGGQRVYRPTHQLFFSAPAVYLVVWKPREGPQQGFVKEWIKLIKHREPDANTKYLDCLFTLFIL